MSNFISGEGTPRLIVVLARPSGYIVASSVANPSVIKCQNRHRLVTGRTVRISGHSGSTPSINNDYVITKIDEYHFSIPVNVTVAGSGGYFEALTHIYESTGATTFTGTTANESGAPTFSTVKVNHRILSWRVVSGLSYPTFGKVTNKTSGTITFDGWSNGIPTDGQKFRIDGFIADWPRCQDLTEQYDPDYLEHELYRGDEGSEIIAQFRGYKYSCTMDYSQYLSADALIDARYFFGAGRDDRLILVPRKDAPQFQYNVLLANSFELRKRRSTGYKKPVFVFKSKTNVQNYALQDGYGINYAANFGTNF